MMNKSSDEKEKAHANEEYKIMIAHDAKYNNKKQIINANNI